MTWAEAAQFRLLFGAPVLGMRQRVRNRQPDGGLMARGSSRRTSSESRSPSPHQVARLPGLYS
jgi:hypothetical protein